MSQNYSKASASPADRAIARFAEAMINRMEEMKSESWKKGWLPAISGGGIPINISGRAYTGSNPFILGLLSAEYGYKAPVFMTFNQAQKLDIHIKKGESSFPVIYFQPIYKDKDGNKIDPETIRGMSMEELNTIRFIPVIRVNNVFNIDQTTLSVDKPDLYNKIVNRFIPKEYTDTEGMYVNKDLDNLVSRQNWVCPIRADKSSDQAFYSPSKDYIVIPTKGQFNIIDTDFHIAGQEYYGTMLHEMAHSTGHASRLNRIESGHFGSPKYAREELVAELTAAYVASSLGFDKKLDDRSACYLNSWISVLKEEPKFILSVLPAVGKASEMIIDHIDKMKIELGEKPVAAFDFLDGMEITDAPFKDISLVRDGNNGLNIRASYGDIPLGMKPVSARDADIISKLSEPNERNLFQKELCTKVFSEEIKTAKALNKKQCHMTM